MGYWLFCSEEEHRADEKRAKSCQKQSQGARCNHRRRMMCYVRDCQWLRSAATRGGGRFVDWFELDFSSASRFFRRRMKESLLMLPASLKTSVKTHSIPVQCASQPPLGGGGGGGAARLRYTLSSPRLSPPACSARAPTKACREFAE